MPELTEVANGLAFPEGPIAMPDGSVVLVEMFGPRLTPRPARRVEGDDRRDPRRTQRCRPRARTACSTSATTAAASPRPTWTGSTFPGGLTRAKYIGGRIQTVDPATGTVTDLYTECDGHPLLAPNDLVFDAHGGFYFTDHGLVDDEERVHKIAGIYYAQADGSGIKEVVYPTDDPNGIGLSPDGTTLYWAETWRGRILQRDITRARRGRRARARRHVAVPVRLPGLPAPRLAGRRFGAATCASRRSSTAACRSCRRPASSSTSSRPAT